MADIILNPTHVDVAETRSTLLGRLAWGRILALGFCAAFWAGVAYLIFH